MDHAHHEARHVVVVSGAGSLHPNVGGFLPPHATIVAADSGWDRACEIGLVPNVLIGDMDSIRAQSLVEAGRDASSVVRHEVDKDFTDIELALAHAASISSRITVVSGGGGRVDHAMAEIVSLTCDAVKSCTVDGFVGAARVHVVRDGGAKRISARIGSLVSVLAVGAHARGVSLNGCKWQLDNASLSPHESRGVSNVATSPVVDVHVSEGCLIVIEPFFLDEEVADNSRGAR